MKKTTCIITVLLLIILACVGTWIGLNVHSLHRDPKKDHTPTRLGRDHIIKDKLNLEKDLSVDFDKIKSMDELKLALKLYAKENDIDEAEFFLKPEVKNIITKYSNSISTEVKKTSEENVSNILAELGITPDTKLDKNTRKKILQVFKEKFGIDLEPLLNDKEVKRDIKNLETVFKIDFSQILESQSVGELFKNLFKGLIIEYKDKHSLQFDGEVFDKVKDSLGNIFGKISIVDNKPSVTTKSIQTAKESAPESSQESVSRNELANKESPAARKVEKQELKEQKKTEIGKDVYSDTHGTIVERPLIEKQPSEDTSKYKPPSTHTISHTDKNIAKEPRGDKTSDPMKDVEDIKRSLEETDQLEKFKAETENSESIRKMVSEINQIIKPGKDWVNVQQERVKIEKMVNEAQKLLRSSKPSTDGHTSITQNKLLNSDMNETIRKEREDLQKITDEIISTLKEAQRIEKENKEKEEGELQIQPKENDIKDKSNSDSAITDNGKGSSTKIKKKTKKPKGLSDGDKLLKEIIEKDAKENKALEEMAKITKEQYANV
ncbi:hypothetical protein BMR1_03g04760 [Babesia microti strain RI]|uniref:Uncharacterized protein n=1 Tax=Babesia microti (strain RI) TaxID=1133968 RepID=A0A0K3APF7_BABMR|nr:hypothetical protein BMR1_03g04760 [Babesia microti strain RI]CTQ41549.1 hypothetical protein BMR1_03g04760 [Babesia microti strain RI]|eukprot:XP_012649560.1 hypothetical protein BMR1_03g04760 [Babesia microti strain RI]